MTLLFSLLVIAMALGTVLVVAAGAGLPNRSAVSHGDLPPPAQIAKQLSPLPGG